MKTKIETPKNEQIDFIDVDVIENDNNIENEMDNFNPWSLHKLVDKKPFHVPTASNTLYTKEKGSEDL